LRLLYGQVFIPPAVQAELLEGVARGDHPDLESAWGWITVQAPAPSGLLDALSTQLDPGEAEAIALAHELSADLLLMDERLGRKIAVQHGLEVAGVLGILLEAKALGHIPTVRPLMEQLRDRAGFWIGASLYAEALRLAEEA